ncbi:MAG: FAD-dependent oxidoreductase [Candidatus Neomarinimicrobiota bacterium]
MRKLFDHPILQVKESELVHFLFNGEKYQGIKDQAVSSALIANNIHVFSHHHKNNAAQGIFCANGQCSHCTVLINGMPMKSCVTPLNEGMDIRRLEGLSELPIKDHELRDHRNIHHSCDVLVVGGGPSGLIAALELAEMDFKIILVDDKSNLGGKLLLQTHKFFGSKEDCYAGTRGHEIAKILENKIKAHKNIKIMCDTMVAGIFKDKKAGLFVENKAYHLVDFKGIIISTGARERSLIFPGNHLPGVYGAGAFQTLVNRDLVKSSDEIFIVGSGNVGLIAAYHALQAGIKVKGICDILPEPSAYKVHADKIKRMGVPLYMKHTILHAEGDDKLQKITIAKINDNNRPILETAKTFKVDTLLIAVGLAPIDSFFNMAEQFAFPTVKTGDADEIAEASSAMFGGHIAGLQMAKKLGKNIKIDEDLYRKAEILKSHPGNIYPKQNIPLTEKYQPMIHCLQEIPCNPCETICPVNAISLHKRKGNIMDVPEYHGDCIGCMKCVTICPGLAISLAKKISGTEAEIVLPYEFLVDFKAGKKLALCNINGDYLEDGEVLKIRFDKKTRTTLLSLRCSLKNAKIIAGIRIQDKQIIKAEKDASINYFPDNAIVCSCEMLTVKEVKDYILEHKVRDINQLKNIRVGMGACGGNNCSLLLPRIFKSMDIDFKDVYLPRPRPSSVEIPLQALINEEINES